MRYTVTGSGGVRNGCQYAVLDNHAPGKRVAWFKTFAQAKKEARRLNNAEALKANGGWPWPEPPGLSGG